MSDQWHYRMFGEEFGPVPMTEILAMQKAGMLGADDDVRCADSNEWTTVASAFLSDGPATQLAAAERTSSDPAAWFYRRQGREIGPLSFDQLMQSAQGGELAASDEVKLGADGKWRIAGTIGRLVAVLPFSETQARVVPGSSAPVVRPAAPTTVARPEPVEEPAQKSVANSTVTEVAPPRRDPKESISRTASPLERPAGETVATRPAPAGYGDSSTSLAASAPRPTFTPATARPPAKTAKSRSSTGEGGFAANLTNPKSLGVAGLAAIAVVVAIFYLLPEGKGADLKKLETLQQLLDEYRKQRNAGTLPAFAETATESVKPMIAELRKTADIKHPWRRQLLWAAENRLGEMLKNDPKVSKIAEVEFEANLYEAAKALGVAKGDPPKGVVDEEPASSETTTSE